ncbi:hypothetical protein [Alicyclobacillus contaminans]|uniref:hypothetical protein n=1 Tax=Alicyclobacillus contaminans TaxID=392016 RepID=UPI00047B973A|nr:hypothetical protein [Alicyclobacillus contaminans]
MHGHINEVSGVKIHAMIAREHCIRITGAFVVFTMVPADQIPTFVAMKALSGLTYFRGRFVLTAFLPCRSAPHGKIVP